jgi:MFS family permease
MSSRCCWTLPQTGLQFPLMIEHIPPVPDDSVAIRRRSRAILITLLFPTMAIILGGSMFGVALPTIRDEFVMTADVAAWLTIAFSLPFMMFMPLYGRLGDMLSRSRLLLLGLFLFCVGAVLALLANNLTQLFLGRFIQGAGAAGITPLSLAIIAQRFLPEERGRALGTWNSIAPGTSIFAPSIGGFLVDSFGWRTIFIPILFVGLFAAFVVRWQIPPLRGKSNWAVLREFDWRGVLLMSTTVTTLVLYISSRPVTGVEPLQDWRLLLGVVLFGTVLVRWERRHREPLVDLHMLANHAFRLASLTAALRMAMMTGIGFLAPLYLTDLYGLTAATIGLLASFHSTALFVVIRFGSSLADRLPNRGLVTASLSVQTIVMGYFALLPADRPLIWFAAGAVIHGLGAGFSLAALHRITLGSVDDAHTGTAAGLYSMTRFAGSMLAVALAGVILQNGLDRGLTTLQAYQLVYAFLSALGLLGVLLAYRLPQ